MLYCFQSSSQEFSSISVNTTDIDHVLTNAIHPVVSKKASTRGTDIGGEQLAETSSLEEQLFSNRSDLKMLVSRIAMHITESMRRDIFKQIDELLDVDSFGDDDSFVTPKSFSTFLKFFTIHPKMKRVALTVSTTGIIGGTWVAPAGKIHIDFLPNNGFRTSISRKESDEIEYLAHQGSLRSLRNFLRQTEVTSWFLHG